MGVVRNTSGTFEYRWPDIPLFVPDQAKQVVADVQRETMQAALLELAGAVSEEAPKNFGHLAQSFSSMPATATGGIELIEGSRTTTMLEGRVFSSLPYAVVMEEGRQPNRPIGRAGIAGIGLWVRRKLGLSGKDAQSATWAIATSIARKGIPGKFYAKAAFTKSQARIQSIFAAAAKGIADGLTKGR